MPPVFFTIGCPVVGVVIILVVCRIVRRANRKISAAHTQVARAQVRIEAAERTTVMAREQHQAVAGMASQGVGQAGGGARGARKIDTVADQITTLTGQVDTLLGFVSEAATALIPSRPRGRHALPPNTGQQAVPETKQTE